MTPLADILVRRIRQQGPIRLADYMAECLLHPDHGYYTRAEPFGAGGDFITAPEISQMFGEMSGLCLAQAWLDQGAPAPFTLAELGPGRGTLMADVLRATRGVPGFHAALRLHLVEASPRLRAAQAAALPDHAPVWLDRVDDLPEAPLFLIANEFFDALPIRQFTRHAAGWQETMVTVQDDRLALALAPPSPLAVLAPRLADTHPGDVVEICPAAASVTASIAARIGRHGGAALLIDYGGWTSLGDTFQALQSHAPVDPMAAPGRADLTAHVDFAPLAAAAATAGAAVSGLTPQGDWLLRLGMGQRAETLAARLQGAARDTHMAAFRRLTAADEMGTLFKVLGLYPADSPPLAGLDP